MSHNYRYYKDDLKPHDYRYYSDDLVSQDHIYYSDDLVSQGHIYYSDDLVSHTFTNATAMVLCLMIADITVMTQSNVS